MVFDDEFSTVPFMREGTMPPNFTDIVQLSSQSGAPDNIDLKDTWFTPYLVEDPIKTPIHKRSVAPENANNSLMLSEPVRHVQ